MRWPGTWPGGLTIPTVSYQDSARFDAAAFEQFHRYLEAIYPEVFRQLDMEKVNRYSLLFKWAGSNPELKPVLLMAHIDVVPVEPNTESHWTQPPFSGAIADGYIWGRGAIDDKASLFSIMDAVQALLQEGFQPQRTIYLAFGHDEELGGNRGARRIAELLAERNVRLEFVLDEGGARAGGLMPGVQPDVAMIGVAEKGYVSVELTVKGTGGHSSMPPLETSVGILCKAIAKLEEHQMPAELVPPVDQMFRFLGPEMPFSMKLVMANLWLFKGMLASQLTQNPTTNAMVRTTTAPTMLEGSIKENVLPTRARGVVNFRIRPSDDVDAVVEHIRRTVNDDRVQIRVLAAGRNPSPVSSVEAPQFAFVMRTIREMFPGTIVTPSLVVGGTDSKHFSDLSPNIYRFIPVKITPGDLHRFHGIDERISVQNYVDMVKFYIHLIKKV
ncbi:MAG: M20 family peptidase [candidate division KSB1 bacterium]|nr:M20 family peptidase [candidate division KSB1 bacterium]